MAQKIIKIFLDPDTISRLKNRAGMEGQSTSECARLLIESGLENHSGSKLDSLERPTKTPPDGDSLTLVREFLSAGLGELKTEILDLRSAIGTNAWVDGQRIHKTIDGILQEKRGELRGMAGYQSFLSTPLVAWMTGLFLGISIFAGTGWFLFQKGKENGIALSTSMIPTIDSLLKCEAPGWKIQTTKEGKACYPHAAKDGLHGWRLP